MKKIVKSLVLIILIFSMSILTVMAADANDIVDGSYLTTNDEASGKSTAITRGVYLQDGFSSISRVGTGLITAGGGTTAQRVVSDVTVNVEVQRLVGSSWQTYTMWTARKSNGVSIISSKNLSVPRGYYYRVKCIHSANSDVSSSFTDGLYIS